MSGLPESYEDRPRIGRDEIEEFLEDLGSRLPRPILAFDIGGAPMVLRGLKDGTKDIDLVLESKEDREVLADVLRDMGYAERTTEPEYEGLEGLLFSKEGAVGVDLFVHRIMKKLVLSDRMKERADPPVGYGNLRVRRCANEDIFILKAVTKRPDDDLDLYFLLETGLDVETMRDELEAQPPRTGPPGWNRYVVQCLSDVEEREGQEIVIKSDLLP